MAEVITIIIPVYNEENRIEQLLEALTKLSARVVRTKFLIVDDGSTDSTFNLLKQSEKFETLHLETNLGKGGAVIAGILKADTPFVGIYDGDLEYDPSVLLEIDKQIDGFDSNQVLFASRYLAEKTSIFKALPGQSLTSSWMNLILKGIYKYLLQLDLSDPLTGVKVYPRKIFLSQKFKRKGFDGDHEIACYLSRAGFKILEISVGYKPRTREEGKKIRAIDAVYAIRTIILGKLNC
jgi:glycosyltransferase involved in cell wall biosynthesis